MCSSSLQRFVFRLLVFNFEFRHRSSLIHQGLQVPKRYPPSLGSLILLEDEDDILTDAKKLFPSVYNTLYVFLQLSLEELLRSISSVRVHTFVS